MGIRKTRGYQDIEGVSGAELPDRSMCAVRMCTRGSLSSSPLESKLNGKFVPQDNRTYKADPPQLPGICLGQIAKTNQHKKDILGYKGTYINNSLPQLNSSTLSLNR